jgi:hypothetical protein
MVFLKETSNKLLLNTARRLERANNIHNLFILLIYYFLIYFLKVAIKLKNIFIIIHDNSSDSTKRKPIIFASIIII